jgi:predicted nucleic acid-binding protein
MPVKPRVFLDTSALFAGIWSSEGGARMLLIMGEMKAIQLVINRQVLLEIENTLRTKAPSQLGALVLLLDRSQIEIVSQEQSEIITIQQWVTHPGDARILASALESKIDYFVTLDRKHFLNNRSLRQAAPFLIGTPGDFLIWYRSYLLRMAAP